jgi:pyrroloquinoline quinone (PQQ) biosynthesis protein C
MVTVAIRGPLADRMRELAESHGMSLSKLLKDALLVYGSQVDAGYVPGAQLARWQREAATSLS